MLCEVVKPAISYLLQLRQMAFGSNQTLIPFTSNIFHTCYVHKTHDPELRQATARSCSDSTSSTASWLRPQGGRLDLFIPFLLARPPPPCLIK